MNLQRTLNLRIGELIIAKEPSIISTVLGSCVSVCLFSEGLQIGGMIHYALPSAPQEVKSNEALRYGEIAIKTLVDHFGAITGQAPHQFLAKVIGGSSDASNQFDIGGQNIEVARRLLKDRRIAIIGENVAGPFGRKALFHTGTGRLQVAKIKSIETKANLSAPPTKPRKVLIVDDSKTIRDLLRRILKEDPLLTVVGEASDPVEAAKILNATRPDVITLDIHMPRMSGVEWLKQLLPQTPIPVVMISSLQFQEGNEVFRALELGAVDYIQKPTLSELTEVSLMIREKVKAASFANVRSAQPQRVTRSQTPRRQLDAGWLLAIGASTGGTEAIRRLLMGLPQDIPPTVVVQHIPSSFSKAFANRLNELCPFEVKEAQDKDEVKRGRVLIAPGGKQMALAVGARDQFIVRINDDPPVSRHKPSVDYLFNTVAELAGPRAVGVILTGMGADGAKGLLKMKERGARTLSQDEKSSVVYGMPKVAFEIGASQEVHPLEKIPEVLIQWLQQKSAA